MNKLVAAIVLGEKNSDSWRVDVDV